MALALLTQWPTLHLDPGLRTVLAALDRAADIERYIGNAEAREDYWSILRNGYWTDIARALDPVAPTVCSLVPHLRYDDELPGFFLPWMGEVPVGMVRDRIREMLK